MQVAANAGTVRFELVSAGHRFLIEALPPHRPNSQRALERFVAAIGRIDPLPADLEAVLLRCLSVFNRHISARVPSLVDMYLSRVAVEDPLRRFSQCVEDRLRYEGIRNGFVQEALHSVDSCYSSPSCTPQSIAASVGLRLSTLDVAFKRETGGTLTERIRDTRLERAALLLATTSMTIKEVWAAVGYNHHSNFDHDFNRHFGVAPREFRARVTRPEARTFLAEQQPASRPGDAGRATRAAKVLIVDDDPTSRTMLATWLQSVGHSVAEAKSGAECLAQVAAFSPTVILLDYHLEDMDGLRCLRALRELARADVPAVAVFTADWDVLERSAEVAELDAMVASKLCDLEQVSDLVMYLTSPFPVRKDSDISHPLWKQWVRFL